MKHVLTTLVIISTALTACSRTGKKSGGEEKPTFAAEDARHKDKSVLRIERTMLRDLRITTAPVERRSGGESSAILGELHPNESTYAEIGVPVASRILEVSVAPGERVEPGQTLALLQNSEVGKARSEAISAQSRVDLANRALQRKRRLGAERIVAEREIQEAEAAVESATAELKSARATLRSLGLSGSEADRLSDDPTFSLRSPVSGMVIDRDAIQGQLAEPTRVLFRVGNLDRLWLTAHAFERDAVRVRPGSHARIVFAALPGRSFTGQVTLIGKQVEPESRTVPIRIEVENRDGSLRLGMSATAWLTVGQETGEVLAVPAASLQRIQERWIVFIPKSSEEFEMRQVGRGRDLGGEVEIVSGLNSGETVVVDGAFLLKAQAERSLGEGEEHDH